LESQLTINLRSTSLSEKRNNQRFTSTSIPVDEKTGELASVQSPRTSPRGLPMPLSQSEGPSGRYSPVKRRNDEANLNGTVNHPSTSTTSPDEQQQQQQQQQQFEMHKDDKSVLSKTCAIM